MKIISLDMFLNLFQMNSLTEDDTTFPDDQQDGPGP